MSHTLIKSRIGKPNSLVMVWSGVCTFTFYDRIFRMDRFHWEIKFMAALTIAIGHKWEREGSCLPSKVPWHTGINDGVHWCWKWNWIHQWHAQVKHTNNQFDNLQFIHPNQVAISVTRPACCMQVLQNPEIKFVMKNGSQHTMNTPVNKSCSIHYKFWTLLQHCHK